MHHIEPTTRPWTAYQQPCLQRKTIPHIPSHHQLPIVAHLGLGPYEPLSHPCWALTGLILGRALQVVPVCCESMSTAVRDSTSDPHSRPQLWLLLYFLLNSSLDFLVSQDNQTQCFQLGSPCPSTLSTFPMWMWDTTICALRGQKSGSGRHGFSGEYSALEVPRERY